MRKGLAAIRQGEKIAALSEKTFEKVKRVRAGASSKFSSRNLGLHMILYRKTHVAFGTFIKQSNHMWTKISLKSDSP